ncbi:hypothetical protein [Gillisia sp. Hel_I_86]|uniref:hypothetical protein n=1 Tax=Gillisia sp. Hel_I_86 TaxID=1249981 RepID=UPI0039655F8A
MNTALYAIAKAAEVNGIEVSGFRKGYEGLIDNDWRGIKNLGASPPGMHWKIILKIRGKTRGIKPSMRD